MNLEAFWWDDAVHLGEWIPENQVSLSRVRFPAHDVAAHGNYAQSDGSVNCHRCRTWAQEQIDALQELLR